MKQKNQLIKPNSLYNMDCIEGMSLIEQNSVNLVVTSPPYNLWNKTVHNKIKYNTYDDSQEFSEYLAWLKKVFAECYRVMADSGRVVINIGSKKNGSIPTHYHIMKFMFELGFNYYTTIIWNKSQTARRTAWGSYLSPSCPSFPTPFEYILVFHKGSRKLIHKGETDLTKEEFIKWSLSIWTFTPETQAKKLGHPAMFPLELPKRCIKMFSYPGDVVLDPFSGLGTTCVEANLLSRIYVGFEIDPLYHKIAVKRIA